MDRWTDRQMVFKFDGLVEKEATGQMDRWTDRSMRRWTDVQMDN